MLLITLKSFEPPVADSRRRIGRREVRSVSRKSSPLNFDWRVDFARSSLRRFSAYDDANVDDYNDDVDVVNIYFAFALFSVLFLPRRHTHLNLSLSLFLNGPFAASFFFIFIFSIQLTVNKCSINFADDWIRTADLWYRKRPLYQLSHNHFPFCAFLW